ncbi:hypothetical protein ASD74_02535 [Rhizobium sp. Root564]|nr:hypothetical protein ASD74_02535 [Rhizobium sp. Root564]
MSVAPSLFETPISDRDRGFLRRLSDANDWRALAEGEAPSAVQCMRAGYARLSRDRRSVIITGKGRDYLLQVAKVH